MKASRFWLSGLTVLALGFAVWKASTMILIVLSAVVLSIFIESMAIYLEKYLRLPRFLSIILVFFLVIGVFAFLIISSVPVFIKELDALRPFIPNSDNLDSISKALNLSSEDSSSFLVFSPELISEVASPIKGTSQTVFKMITSTFGGLANVILLGIMSLYLALEEKAIERLILAVAPEQTEQYIVSLWSRIKSKTEGWFRGQMIVALIVGIATYVGLLVLGVKYAFLLSALAAVLGIIPFGIIVAFLPALGISLAHGEVLTPVYVAILYGGIQYINDYLIQPLITRRSTGLPPLLVIISIVVSLTLFGLLGSFIAIPASIFLLEIVQDMEKQKSKEDDSLVASQIEAVPELEDVHMETIKY